MPFRVSGKNISIGEALRGRVNQRIAEATAKYFDGGYSGHVTIGKDGFGFRTDCVVYLDSGIILEADAIAGDAYSSADQAAERIEKRLRRYKSRLKDRQAARVDGLEAQAADEDTVAAASYVLAAPEYDTQHEIAGYNPAIIAESTTELKRMSVSEAVMQLDMTGSAVVVFRHAGHGRVNLVYRRADGHIGWIDPQAAEPKEKPRDSH